MFSPFQANFLLKIDCGCAHYQTKDEGKLGMLTREYIAEDNLQFQLSRAIKALHVSQALQALVLAQQPICHSLVTSMDL